MQSSVAELKHQICTQTHNKTILSDMHVHLEHTARHARMHAPTQQSYKYTSKLQCSTELKHMVLVEAGKLKKDLVSIINGMEEKKKVC